MKNWKEGVVVAVVSFHLTTEHWKLYKRNWTQQRIRLWAGVRQAWQHLNVITRDLPCNSCIETHFPALNIVITKVEY